VGEVTTGRTQLGQVLLQVEAHHVSCFKVQMLHMGAGQWSHLQMCYWMLGLCCQGPGQQQQQQQQQQGAL
jgi:hypothetical protein